MDKRIGHYAFIVGALIAIILGLAQDVVGDAAQTLTSIMLVLGLIVGMLNIQSKHTAEYLMAAAVVVVIATLADIKTIFESIDFIGIYIYGVISNLVLFIIPVAVMAGIKDLWVRSQNN